MGSETHFDQVARGSVSRPPLRPEDPWPSRLRKTALVGAVCGAAIGAAASAVDQQLERRAMLQERAREDAVDYREWRVRNLKATYAVRDGELPPVALLMLQGGPEPEEDVVGALGDEDELRTRDRGRGGPPLVYDVDGDGRIARDERRVTEDELGNAVSWFMSG